VRALIHQLAPAQDQDAVALAALAAVREEIVVASIRSTDVVAVLDGSAGLSSLVPAEIGEMSVAAAEHAALVSAEISETRLAAAEPGRFRVLEGGDLSDLKGRSRALLSTFLKGRGFLQDRP